MMMTGIDGVALLEELQRDKELKETPVIILTASSDPELKQTALRLGVSDFLDKPVDPHHLVARVRNALIMKAHRDHLVNYASELEKTVQLRTAELAASRREVIRCLARAAEFRDNETGNHVVRVGRYVGIVARELGFSDERVELLEDAAQLHDVGKIGIPDAILLKPAGLEPEEFEQMQKHAKIGAEMLNVVRSPVIELASSIALTHHEKWDGSGYPLGLAGDDIPIEGRMTAVADVFDALSSKRPYKAAFPHKKCFQIMEDGRGKHFDPRVLDAFFRRRAEIAKVQIDCADLD
jgi:putative two-component system response regulator